MIAQSRNWWILLLCAVAAVMAIRMFRGSFDLGNFSLGFFGGVAVFRLKEFLHQGQS